MVRVTVWFIGIREKERGSCPEVGRRPRGQKEEKSTDTSSGVVIQWRWIRLGGLQDPGYNRLSQDASRRRVSHFPTAAKPAIVRR